MVAMIPDVSESLHVALPGGTLVKPDTPFDSIEGSYQYVSLLAEAIDDAAADLEEEIAAAVAQRAARREQALRLAAFKLARLAEHVKASRVLLNDLRTLRRLLRQERGLPPEPDAPVEDPPDELEGA
jgi:hypothetical protein